MLLISRACPARLEGATVSLLLWLSVYSDRKVEVASSEEWLVLVDCVDVLREFPIRLDEFAMRAVELLIDWIGLASTRVLEHWHLIFMRGVEDPK